MRACGIVRELPAECADVRREALTHEMKNSANIGMAQNSACHLSEADMDDLARRVLQIPIAKAA